jgi:hypothetical protein
VPWICRPTQTLKPGALIRVLVVPNPSNEDFMKRTIAWIGAAAFALSIGAVGLRADDSKGDGLSHHPDTKKYRDFAEVTQGAAKTEGLFTLYQKEDHLYAEIKPHQFNQPLLVPTTIARGIAQAGMPVGDDDMVLVFQREGDKVQLIRRNIHYRAPAGTPIDKSVKQNYTDSVLMALPIVTLDHSAGNAVVIDFSDIFLTDFAQLGIGSLDRSRSRWHAVKGFPNNLELEVEATFNGGGRHSFRGNDGIADHRGITLVIHYSLMKVPDSGYHPRAADDRVGHFLSATKDFGAPDADTNFIRYINRWRLEKADHKAKMSPPKKQIVWYVEDTVPFEYRPYVEAGIREWNKAFEKIGYRDAIAVRWQESGRDDFDPEDTNYCTFRWVTTDAGFAMSCLRANPISGEMIDGDVVFDASFVRYWKQEYALLIGTSTTANGESNASALAVGDIISPILAAKMGYGEAKANRLKGLAGLAATPTLIAPEVIPSSWGGTQWELSKHLAHGPLNYCQFHNGLHQDFSLAAMAFADASKPGGADKEIPEEFIGQAIKHVVMHEVGHSLGLRHNFKASTMLTAEQLNDTTLTRAKGLVGSVMDYSPVNIAPKGKKQGDFYSTTIGPYDYWVIEYAYKPIDGDEAPELKKIATRAPERDLVYATDEDAMLNNDPLVNRFDLGSDPCQFARDRIALAADLMKNLDSLVIKDGESRARNRRALSILLQQWGNGAHLASQYIGGQEVARDHKGDKDARDPVVPIPGAKQRECLTLLVDQILSDKAFHFSPALLRRLGAERWYHWGSEGGSGIDFPLLERILATQKIVLAQCLDPGVLSRLQNQELQAEPNTNPLKVSEVFRALTDGIWSELKAPAADGKAPTVTCSTIRRNLQREYLRRLSGMVIGGSQGGFSPGDRFAYAFFADSRAVPADARALARLHLKETDERIRLVLAQKDAKIDDTTRAHLEECSHRIAKVLDAGIETSEL